MLLLLLRIWDRLVAAIRWYVRLGQNDWIAAFALMAGVAWTIVLIVLVAR